MLTRSTVPTSETTNGVRRHTTENSTPAPVAPAPLTPTERTALQTLEATIEAGMQTFLDVGNALLRIRDERLYRETHHAFDAYCRARWGFSKTQANRFIAASTVAKNLTPIGVKPTSESQVRLLSSFKPAQQVKVFERAAKQAGGVEKVTAAAIQEAATKMRLVTPRQHAASSCESGTIKRADVIKAVQKWADENWARAKELDAAAFVKEIKKAIADL